MIGEQATGAIDGVVITAVSHEGLRVTINGKPGALAILDEHGQVVACGDQVAREAEAVAINMYRNTWVGQGFLRVISKPIDATNDAARKASAA